MTKILIVDDHPMVIEGVKALLAAADSVEVVGTVNDAFSAMAFLKANRADVVLLDINLPDLSGIDLCQKLKAEFPTLKILAMSTFKERSYITRMIEQGASGYVLKSVSSDELIEAIRQAQAGRMYLSQEVSQVLLSGPTPKPVPLLTSREKEVLACIAEGLTNHEIADKLFVSPLTVDSHRKNLLAKFGVKNTAALVRVAVENQLI
ncbi:response regulator transcription factor [Spirosoma taeanense]|uniref:Response regulator transcription factor n=1 Tax=Spirosoma taeanense TaxID=2735870 RepID=A0A6M5YB85_9BACT|nr:response regulator transcription factor [Spirosoma taeanense]QJW90540.1 response regulator transcription factor [Spirosoma taeanense]